MNSITDKQITEFLASCSPSRLIQILAPVLAAHTKRDFDGNHLVLCGFFQDNEGGKSELNPGEFPWLVSVIAPPPAPQEWINFEEQGYWESGFCDRCHVEIASYAKQGVCPLCSITISLT